MAAERKPAAAAPRPRATRRRSRSFCFVLFNKAEPFPSVFLHRLRVTPVVPRETDHEFARDMASPSPASAVAERRIVVAVDEGEESMHALSWCLTNVVSSTSGDTIVLLHARRPRPVYTAMDSAGYMLTSDVMASVERHANAVSAAAVDKAKLICADHPHVKVETLVESGDPRDVICNATEKIGADLLVMGSHGYGFIQRAFLGSVSNHCAQNCKCPVLIVKRPKEQS